MTVLNNVKGSNYSPHEQWELYNSLYAVLKTIVVLAAPVNQRSLSQLANISSDAVNKALIDLHSIVAIPADPAEPLRLHHASFRDYIMDLNRCSDPRFSVDGKWQQKVLAERCIHLMGEHLSKDICGVGAPGIHESQIDQGLIERQLSSPLQYACRYWVHHVWEADEQFLSFSGISDFLFVHLLHWLEALSLLRRAPEAVHMLRELEKLTVSIHFKACQ